MDLEKIIRKYIDRSIHMSLGTSNGSKPWVCEVHFVYDPDLNLYFRSLKSRRHSQDIASNPSVAGNIVKQHVVGEPGHGIYFEGTASPVESDADRQELFPLFAERLGAKESILEDSRQPDGHQFYKIVVSNWYAFGMFGKDSAQKYQLPWSSK
jgi:uncharacterized protein YhbP (UPF0306 family)